jgi:hypothetical protein
MITKKCKFHYVYSLSLHHKGVLALAEEPLHCILGGDLRVELHEELGEEDIRISGFFTPLLVKIHL